MAINVETLAPASLKSKNVATEQYVDTSVANIDVSGDISANNDVFAQKLGYANYAAMVNAAASGQTVINGGYINTSLIQAGSINANLINTNDLIAENIKASSVIRGNKIEGSLVEGAVIKASYIDLDGELQVLTNYYIDPVNYNANTMPTAVLVNGFYRLPSISRIELLPYTITLTNTVATANGAYLPTNTQLMNVAPYPYNAYTVTSANKCVKAQPTALYLQQDFTIPFSVNYIAVYNNEYGTSTTLKIYFGDVLLFTVVYTRISIDACGGYANFYNVYKTSVNGVSPANQTCMGTDTSYGYTASASSNGFVCSASYSSFVGPYGGGAFGNVTISRNYLSSMTSDISGASNGFRAVVTSGKWPSGTTFSFSSPYFILDNMI